MSLVMDGYYGLLRILYRRKEKYIVIVLPFCHWLQEVTHWLLMVTIHYYYNTKAILAHFLYLFGYRWLHTGY